MERVTTVKEYKLVVLGGGAVGKSIHFLIVLFTIGLTFLPFFKITGCLSVQLVSNHFCVFYDPVRQIFFCTQTYFL